MSDPNGNMGGNPQYIAALQNGDDSSALVSATLALAYEQRTANMLHALEISMRASAPEIRPDVVKIAARLGITPEPLP